MRILWITNIMFPPICKEMDLPIPVVGGWMYSAAQSLLSLATDIELAVATVYKGETLKKSKLDNVIYYLLPLNGDNTKYHKKLEPIWQNVNADFLPDIVHLHGTEFAHGLAFQKACPNIKTVVSIQGLVSIIARYYNDGFPFWERLKNITLRDIVGQYILRREGKVGFQRRGVIEEEIIKHTRNIIGRTVWDKAHTWAMNPKVRYHFCNETLRPIFYSRKWDYSNCEPCRIFLSQAGYTIKGLHQLLKAMPLILQQFPNTKIYIAGTDVTKAATFLDKLRSTGYSKYIKNLIKCNNLTDKVFFTGPLTEDQICREYLKSNLFLCPSSIENSPNSLGEAQLLGVPCLASYVGGIPEMMKGNESNIYRFEEIEMLALKICDVFSAKGNINLNVECNIIERYSAENNTSILLNIYNDILKND